MHLKLNSTPASLERPRQSYIFNIDIMKMEDDREAMSPDRVSGGESKEHFGSKDMGVVAESLLNFSSIHRLRS